MRTRNRQAPCADERVVDDLTRSGEREVGGDETELGVHGRRAEVRARFETVSVYGVAVTPRDPSAEMKSSGRRGSEFVVFEYAEPLLWIVHFDGTVEVEVVERLDQSALLRGAPFALVGVDVEAEGAGAVLCLFGERTVADLGVKVIVGCSARPEFVDVLTEDTAAYKGTGCVLIFEPYDAEW